MERNGGSTHFNSNIFELELSEGNRHQRKMSKIIPVVIFKICVRRGRLEQVMKLIYKISKNQRTKNVQVIFYSKKIKHYHYNNY